MNLIDQILRFMIGFKIECNRSPNYLFIGGDNE